MIQPPPASTAGLLLTDPSTIFIVGASGFIGHYVLAGLLGQQQTCVALMREPEPLALARLQFLISPLGLDAHQLHRAGQLILAQGDINQLLPQLDHLGIRQVVHAAGITHFEKQANGDPYRTNVQGTGNLLQWMQTHQLTRLHLVSSAYQCGVSSKRVPESILHDRPTFNNVYEESKWEAEHRAAVWAQKPGRCLTIYRPSVVVGDQAHGRTTSYSGFYLLGRATELLWQWYEQSPESRKDTGLRIAAQPQDKQNLIPVDHVASAIVHAILDPYWHGKIFHLTHPAGTTNAVIKQALDEHFDFAGSEFADNSVEAQHPSDDGHRLFHETTRVLANYLKRCPDFDRTNALQLERAADLTCPTVDTAFLDRLLDYARSTRWGRRQQQWLTRQRLSQATEVDANTHTLFELYFKHFLPQKVALSRIASMTALSISMRFIIRDIPGEEWLCRFVQGRLEHVARSAAAADESFTYITSTDVFWQAVAGKLDPQKVFLGDLARIEGDVESAIKMMMILHQFNREHPCQQAQLMQWETTQCQAS